MNNIVFVNFECNEITKVVAQKIWQYDYGQILRIQGLNLPSAVEIHFSLQKSGGVAERRIGVTRDGVTDVVIPDFILKGGGIERDYYAYAFIYLSSEEYGQTEHRIELNIISRPEPEGSTGSDETSFGAIMDAVNKIAEQNGQGVSDEKIAEAVNAYMEANPVEGTADVVQYISQNLTEEQQTQARANISAASAEEVSQLQDTNAQLKQQWKDFKNSGNLTGSASIYVPTNNLFNKDDVLGTEPYITTNYILLEAGKTHCVDISGIGRNLNATIYDENKENGESILIYHKNKANNVITAGDSDRYIVIPISTSAQQITEITNDTVKVYVGDEITACHNGYFVSLDNRWYGKRWLVIGDSITFEDTEGTGTGYPTIYLSTKTYPSIIAEALHMDIKNVAIAGRTPKDFFDEIATYSDDFDLITVLLGTNNHGYNHIVGEINGENYKTGVYTSEDYTCQMQHLIDLLKEKYPNSIIALITPLKRADRENADNLGQALNTLGLTTKIYAEQCIAIGDYYGLPVCDLWHNMVNPALADVNIKYFCDSNSVGDGDKLHPNALCHKKRIAPTVFPFIKNLAPFEKTTESDEDAVSKTLESISVVYNGGEIEVGTNLDSLKSKLVVTATYSDETIETVTDYTLSGNIVEGSNTITVTYVDKTTTFEVFGIASSEEDEETVTLIDMTWNRTGSAHQIGTIIPVSAGDDVTLYVEGEPVEKGTSNVNVINVISNIKCLIGEELNGTGYATKTFESNSPTGYRTWNPTTGVIANATIESVNASVDGYLYIEGILGLNDTDFIIRGYVQVNNGEKVVLTKENCFSAYNTSVS